MATRDVLMAYTKYARPILERQPCLDIRTIIKLASSKSGYLHWRTKTDWVGDGDFEWMGAGRFWLEYNIKPLDYVEPVTGSIEAVIVFTPCKTRGHRALLQCPVGGRRTDRLYFFEERWACRGCHGLVYASQRKGQRVRSSERLRELRSEIGPGRPKGMHGGQYLKLLTEYQNLQKQVKDHGEKFASAELSEVVFLAKCVPGSEPVGYNPLPGLKPAKAPAFTARRTRELDKSELPPDPKWYIDEYGDPVLPSPRHR
jgi:hypothetical protein